MKSLRWYSDRHIRIEPEIPRLVKMASFVDYGMTASDEYIVAEVGNLFLHFNRAIGFNQDTAEMRNSLVVVRERSDGTDLMNGLKLSDMHKELINGEEVTIEVCSYFEGNRKNAAYLLVSIGYGDSLCMSTVENPRPTPRPNPLPTRRPTPRPTLRPTPRPTRTPTPRPTLVPTEAPIRVPIPSPPLTTPSVPPVPNPRPPVRQPEPNPSPSPQSNKPVAGGGPTPRGSEEDENEPNEEDSGQGEIGRGGLNPHSTEAPSMTGEPRRSPIGPPAPSFLSLDSPAPTWVTYEGGEGYAGILTPADAGTQNESRLGLGVPVGLAIGMILFGCCCCFCLSRRYRIVCDDDDYDSDEELIEVGNHIVAIRRSRDIGKKAETETLASDEGSADINLSAWETPGDEEPRTHENHKGVENELRCLPSPSSFLNDQWTKALQFWTEPLFTNEEPSPPPRPFRQTSGSEGPSGLSSPPRQSFQPVVVPRSPRRARLFAAESEPYQNELYDPVGSSCNLAENKNTQSRLSSGSSVDSAYDFSNVRFSRTRRHDNRRSTPDDWFFF